MLKSSLAVFIGVVIGIGGATALDVSASLLFGVPSQYDGLILRPPLLDCSRPACWRTGYPRTALLALIRWSRSERIEAANGREGRFRRRWPALLWSELSRAPRRRAV